MILRMFNLSEIPGRNSMVTVPFTCVCNMVYGPVVLIPSFRGFHVFLSIFVVGYNRNVSVFDSPSLSSH